MDVHKQWKLLSLLYILTVLHRSGGQYIDQIIQEAMNDTDPNAMHTPRPGVVQVELDMLFKEDEYQTMVDDDERSDQDEGEDENNASKRSRKKRKAIIGQHKRWTNNIVYYSYGGGFSSRDRSVINSAMNHWERYTCIDFQPANSRTRNYIQYVNGGGCSSYVGMSGGRQPVTLAPGCRVHGTVVHELGHAIGFHHEQTRTDRDSYITIYTQNVIPSTLFNFQKHSTRVINAHGVPYDYRSVMHYGQYAFTSNRQRTIVTKDAYYQNIIGTATGLSFRDVKLATIIYGCNFYETKKCYNDNTSFKPTNTNIVAHCSSKTCPGEGFVGKDCKCWCKGTADPRNKPVVECDGGEITGTRPPVTPSPVTPAPVTPSPGNCVDNNQYCADWAAKGECQSNPGYMLVYCKKSCRVCGGGGGGSNCQDSNGNCASWAGYGYCYHYYYQTYMRQNCRRSCRFCSSAPEADEEVVEEFECKDWNYYCSSWSQSGYCQSNRDYMSMYCPKSCGTC